MAKALYGTVAPRSQHHLLDEIRALRQRIAELESALDDARAAVDQRPDLHVVLDETPAHAGV